MGIASAMAKVLKVTSSAGKWEKVENQNLARGVVAKTASNKRVPAINHV
jgi:hypothetical protein